MGLNLCLGQAERQKRLLLSNLVSATVIGLAFGAAVWAHEAKSDDADQEMRKVAFIQAKPPPKAQAEEPKPEAPKPKPKPKKRLRLADRQVAKALVTPKEIPKVAEKPPEVVEEDSVHMSTEGTLDESEGEIGGKPDSTPGPTAPVVEQPVEVEKPKPKPKPKPVKPIFLRADMPKPERLEGSDPAYTEAAKAAGIEGLVVLLFTITPQGDVTNVRVIKNLPVLGDVCAATVRRWKFKPVIYQDQPVSVIVKQPFLFKLEK